MNWLIIKAFLMPSVEQLLRHQIDSWTSKTICSDVSHISLYFQTYGSEIFMLKMIKENAL